MLTYSRMEREWGELCFNWAGRFGRVVLRQHEFLADEKAMIAESFGLTRQPICGLN
jgi:hypothetical protein